MTSRPHILWVSVDSVRFDHTTMGGYVRDTTPGIASIAAEADGAMYPNCFAHGKYTLASTASILTGTYPSRNQAGYKHEVLPAELPTVPELLSDVGYQTAGFSSNRYISSETGLDRGFKDFLWLHPSTLLGSVDFTTLLRYAANIHRHSAGFSTVPHKHATPYLMNLVARDWLDSRRSGDPFFLFMHYNEPHRPYYPPLPYQDRYTEETSMSGGEAAEFAYDVHTRLEEIVADGCHLSDDEMAALVAMYDAEIAYTDQFVERLIGRVRAADDRDVIVVVTADHGELFGEYGLLGHKFVVNDELTHVPLVTTGLDVPSDELVQHADVMTTILEMVGADTGPLQGIDLRTETRDYVVNQDHDTDFGPFLEHNPEYDVSRFHEGELSSIRTESFRYQESDRSGELFALPDETVDVSDEYEAVRSALATELSSWLREYGTPIEATTSETYSEEMRDHLADMGYLS